MLETEIQSNGSKWAGESPDSIEKLIEVLGECRLNERLFGEFIHRDARGLFFFGNFVDVSHVFSITSNDPEVVASLAVAICRNLLRQHPTIARRIRGAA
jgi:hypothetical protein